MADFPLQPEAYLLAGVSVWETYRFLTGPILRQNWAKSAIAPAIQVGAMTVAQVVRTYQTYFQKWAVAPELHWIYKAEWLEQVRELHEHPPDEGTVYLVPDGHRLADLWEDFNSYTFEYLYQGEAPERGRHFVRRMRALPRMRCREKYRCHGAVGFCCRNLYT